MQKVRGGGGFGSLRGFRLQGSRPVPAIVVLKRLSWAVLGFRVSQHLLDFGVLEVSLAGSEFQSSGSSSDELWSRVRSRRLELFRAVRCFVASKLSVSEAWASARGTNFP